MVPKVTSSAFAYTPSLLFQAVQTQDAKSQANNTNPNDKSNNTNPNDKSGEKKPPSDNKANDTSNNNANGENALFWKFNFWDIFFNWSVPRSSTHGRW